MKSQGKPLVSSSTGDVKKDQRHNNKTASLSSADARRRGTDSSTGKKRERLLIDDTARLPKSKKTKFRFNEVPQTKLKIFMCGSGDSGELGFGGQKGSKAIEAKTPRINPYLDGVVQVAIGGMHGIALTNDNNILTWGVNDQFALGRETPNHNAVLRDIDAVTAMDNADDEVTVNVLEATPTVVDCSAIPAGTQFVQVCAGDSTSFALTSTGEVYGWGIFRDSRGLFGFNVNENKEISDKPQKAPRLIHGLDNIIQIACGSDHALALDNDGAVFAWGAGEHFQLARPMHPAYLHRALTPLRIRFPRPIASIFAGSNHSFAIDKKKCIYSWGLNNFGQCGIPTNAGKASATISSPKLIKSLGTRDIEMIAGGNFHSIAVTKSGECLTWGKMDDFQSGIGYRDLSLDDSDTIRKTESGRPCILLQPTRVPNISDAYYVAAGSDHCLAITRSGRAFSWGFNTSYQCGQSRVIASHSNGSDEDDEDDEDDIDEVKEATPVETRVLEGQHLIWAGAGGQFSAFGASYK